MPFYLVKYDGSYLGGAAVVAAESMGEAIGLVRDDRLTVCFEEVTVTEIPVVGSCVLYNDNGDY